MLYQQRQDLILASSSPRRSEFLSNLGIRFTISPAECDEAILPDEDPEAYVRRLARKKAMVIARTSPDAWIIGADTSVILNGVIFGKPSSKADACAMLRKLQASEHKVTGAFALVNESSSICHIEAHTTSVFMRSMSEDEIAAYVETGEPLDKAGAYAIQGIGGAFVTGIAGSYSNVIGLNIEALVNALKSFGVLV